MILALWRLAMRLFGPILARRLVAKRRTEGVGEERLPELRGVASRARPDGPLVWLHAASVGESLSLLPLIEALQDAGPDLSCLVTTVTPTSAAIMAERLPNGAFHQFAPVDVPRYLRRFLGHWRPDLLVVVENDLWPVMLTEADRAHIPRVRVGASLSARGAQRWQRMPGAARILLGGFRVTAVDDAEAARALRPFVTREPIISGDLKAAAPPPPADPDELRRLRALLGSRPVWAAISTHQGEEELVLAAHDHVLHHLPDALLLLCPRHPERGERIATLGSMDRRSQGEGPQGPVWLVDTIGETGLWYRLAALTFLGGSLVPVGGHNPWEAVHCGTALVHGPFVANAQATWDALDQAGAARMATAETLGETVVALLAEPALADQMTQAARQLLQGQQDRVAQLADVLLAEISPRR